MQHQKIYLDIYKIFRSIKLKSLALVVRLGLGSPKASFCVADQNGFINI